LREIDFLRNEFILSTKYKIFIFHLQACAQAKLGFEERGLFYDPQWGELLNSLKTKLLRSFGFFIDIHSLKRSLALLGEKLALQKGDYFMIPNGGELLNSLKTKLLRSFSFFIYIHSLKRSLALLGEKLALQKGDYFMIPNGESY